MGQFWITGIFSFCLMGPDFSTTQIAMLLGWPSTRMVACVHLELGSLFFFSLSDSGRFTHGSPNGWKSHLWRFLSRFSGDKTGRFLKEPCGCLQPSSVLTCWHCHCQHYDYACLDALVHQTDRLCDSLKIKLK